MNYKFIFIFLILAGILVYLAYNPIGLEDSDKIDPVDKSIWDSVTDSVSKSSFVQEREAEKNADYKQTEDCAYSGVTRVSGCKDNSLIKYTYSEDCVETVSYVPCPVGYVCDFSKCIKKTSDGCLPVEFRNCIPGNKIQIDTKGSDCNNFVTYIDCGYKICTQTISGAKCLYEAEIDFNSIIGNDQHHVADDDEMTMYDTCDLDMDYYCSDFADDVVMVKTVYEDCTTKTERNECNSWFRTGYKCVNGRCVK